MLEIKIKRLFYGQRDLLSDLNLRVEPAERILIVGPTGQGKSSLLNTLSLMNQNYEGSISLDDKDLKSFPPHTLRSMITMVMQEPFLGEGTVREVLQESLNYSANKHLKTEDRASRIKSLFQSFQLPENLMDKSAEQLSGGEKQRVALIRALLLKPRILLLDEISSALDQTTSGIISDCIFKDFPGAVIAISHDPLWHNRWARRWTLQDGKILDSREF